MNVNEIEEIAEQVKPVLDKISKAVEGGAKFSYEVLLRQQYVKVAQVGLGWLFFILFIVIPEIWIYKIGQRQRDDKGYPDDWVGVLGVCLGVSGAVLLIVLVIGSFDAVGILINPNYYVFQDVSRLLLGTD